MKTLIAFIIAMLGFSATLAWSAEPAPATNSVTRPAAKASKAAPSAKNPARTPAVPAFDDRLLQGPAVLCACGRSRTQA